MSLSETFPLLEDLPDVLRTYLQEEPVSEERLPRKVEYSPPVQEVLDEFLRLSHWNPVEVVTPTKASRDREQKAFFHAYKKEEVYEPCFDYVCAEYDVLVQRSTLEKVQRTVSDIATQSAQESIICQALQLAIEDQLATCTLIEALQDTTTTLVQREERIRDVFDMKYPPVDPLLAEDAKGEYRRLQQGSSDTFQKELSEVEVAQLESTDVMYNADDIRNALEWVLQSYGLLQQEPGDGKFTVSICDEVTSIDVRPYDSGGPVILIPRGRKVTGKQLLRLCVHEIEGHVLQYANAQSVLGDAHRVFTLSDETFQEGLALFREDAFLQNFFGEDRRPLPFYILAVTFIEDGQEEDKSFSAVFRQQVNLLRNIDSSVWPMFFSQWDENISHEENCLLQAWLNTYRVMRGHVDMRNPLRFANRKDVAYFRGMRWVELLERLRRTSVVEGAVASTDVFHLLAPFALQEADLAYPFQMRTGQYARLLLRELEAREK
ncbi:hypothetical protein COU77_04250 [Candidatus Peregrinibacteria bacterium CG10_big_fil_rev_8_21_14_0_10_49_16]|nr:MAG: hypothetical protein COW95_01565 [Candidatus Peregrinibacteria bacterium CG22_combo_CG10-13_8_21_14_all_49_11]PIR51705.1 MAG: hypothetical protein COU77_04250 [Candidatus Peregrinibacteria bacterium CG10_big_fil_rev_8_21_14_0_10_49_16]